MNAVHMDGVDLNLLRVFDAVYRTRNVSRAAELLALTQPAASHALTRLRLLLKDPLFVRGSGGVQPTPRAERLAPAVQAALTGLAQALDDMRPFVAAQSSSRFRIHMSDIGEARFLPAIMAALKRLAPAVVVETLPLPQAEIAAALDSGKISFAFGYLPAVKETQRRHLLQDRYIVLLREGHALARRRRAVLTTKDMRSLDYAAVRSHSETLHILQQLKLEDRLRLSAAHFLALPAIVRETDLGVLMPQHIAEGFAANGGFALARPQPALRPFSVSLHWSRRFEADPANRWLRELLIGLFLQD
jgi:DNA-binding transcriptional LysR family regulator